MSAAATMANDLFAKLGMHGVDADLTVTDHAEMPEVDGSVIVLGELSVSEVKLFGAMRKAIDDLESLHSKAMAALLHNLADRMAEGTRFPGGIALEVEKGDMMAALPAAIREEFVRHNTMKDAAKSVLFLTVRQRLNYWGFDLEIRRGGNICIPR